nr:hypothetical protein [Psychrobacter sp. PraFG1]UNK06310.1 hypothetical protein MN210_07125 [Psychrobacter sp. PraFG1]
MLATYEEMQAAKQDNAKSEAGIGGMGSLTALLSMSKRHLSRSPLLMPISTNTLLSIVSASISQQSAGITAFTAMTMQRRQ